MARKLSARWRHLAVPLIQSVIMTFVVSGVATFNALGLSQNFFATWMSAWPMSFVIAFPISLFALPAARWMAGRFVDGA